MLLGFKLSRAILMKIFNGHLVRIPAVPSLQVTFTLALRCISSRSACVTASTLLDFSLGYQSNRLPLLQWHQPSPAPTSSRHRTSASFNRSFLSPLTLLCHFTVLSSCSRKTPFIAPPALEDDGFRARDCGPRENVRELRTGRYGMVIESQL